MAGALLCIVLASGHDTHPRLRLPRANATSPSELWQVRGQRQGFACSSTSLETTAP